MPRPILSREPDSGPREYLAQGVTSVSGWKFVIFNGELGFVNHLARIVTSELTKRSKPVHHEPLYH
jgi:hypothetical protein